MCVHYNMKPQESSTRFPHVLSTSKQRSFYLHRQGKTCQKRGSSEEQSIHSLKSDKPSSSMSCTVVGAKPTAKLRGVHFVFRNRLRVTWPLSHVRRARSRLRSFSCLWPMVSLLGPASQDSSDCDLVHGLSCCAQDARCKHVHSAIRLTVFLRGQQQRHKCVYPEHQRTRRTWKNEDKQENAQTGRIQRTLVPIG